MWTSITILSLVTLQRIVELYIVRRNTNRLLTNGAVEVGSGHYYGILVFNVIWLLGLWYLVLSQPLFIDWSVAFAYLVLQAARGWIVAALGRRWTTRIIIVPGEEVTPGGTYKYVRQPHYLILAAEIFLLPMVFGLWWYSLLFGFINLGLLYFRINAEEDALGPLRGELNLPPEDAAQS
jgi:methyltransferase